MNMNMNWIKLKYGFLKQLQFEIHEQGNCKTWNCKQEHQEHQEQKN